MHTYHRIWQLNLHWRQLRCTFWWTFSRSSLTTCLHSLRHHGTVSLADCEFAGIMTYSYSQLPEHHLQTVWGFVRTLPYIFQSDRRHCDFWRRMECSCLLLFSDPYVVESLAEQSWLGLHWLRDWLWLSRQMFQWLCLPASAIPRLAIRVLTEQGLLSFTEPLLHWRVSQHCLQNLMAKLCSQHLLRFPCLCFCFHPQHRFETLLVDS